MLIGALGGIMTAGIISLFVCSVIVAVSYTVFMAWVDEQPSTEPDLQQEDPANNYFYENNYDSINTLLLLGVCCSSSLAQRLRNARTGF